MEIKIRESVIKKKRFDFFFLVLGIKNALINLKKSFWCKQFQMLNVTLNKNVTFSICNRVKYCALSWTVNRPLRAKEVVITHHKASSCIMMQVTRNGMVFKIKDR